MVDQLQFKKSDLLKKKFPSKILKIDDKNYKKIKSKN